MKRSLTLPLVLFSLVLSGFLIADDRPNIIFFFADDQRHDTLGCAGHPILETPTIDKLAEEGVRFTNMFVTRSTCWASRTTILTGLTSRSSVKGDGSDQIRPEALTELFPNLLRDAGYRTGFYGKWHAKMPKGFKPEEHFDEYERIFRRPYFKTMPDGSKRHETELIADRGIEFLKSQKENDQPFCLNLWFNAGHAEDNDRVPGTGHFPGPKAMDGKYEDIEIPRPRLSDPAIWEAHPERSENQPQKTPTKELENQPEMNLPKENKRTIGGLLKGLLGLAVASSPNLSAQDNAGSETYTLDPFTVTSDSNTYHATNSISGTRVNMAIKDIPVPITVITEQLIEDFSYERVEDAVVSDATITRVGRNEGNFNENFTIRGFRSSLNLRNRIPYKGFTDSSMIDRIEIVKGPAAVLYGLSDPGGLVNIITKKPLNVRHTSVNFRVGSESNRRVEWDTGGPLDNEGKVLFRFTGSYDEGGHQRPGGWHNQRFFTPAFTFLPTDKTKIDIEYSRQERHHAFIRPRNPFVGNGFAPNDRWQPVSQDYSPITDRDYTLNEGDAWSIDLTQTFNDNMFLRATVSDTTKFTDMFNLVGCCTNAEDVFTGISNVEILENDNANYYVDFNVNFDIGETSHTFLIGAQRDDSDSFGQTYRLNGGSGALRTAMMDAVPGAPGGYPVTPYNVLTNEGKNPDGTAQMNVTREQAQDLAIQFRANGVGGATANQGSPGFAKNESFFVMDQIKAMEGKLNVLAGLRRDSIEQNNLEKISNTSIQAGFTYEVADGLNFYSLYSESFVPNAQRVDTRVDPALVLVFEPSQGEGIDIGFKFDMIEGKLSGSVAYFDIDRTNILQNNPLPEPPPDEPIAFLSGLENSTGYEAQIFYTPTPDSQFILSYAHNDAKIAESLIPGAEGLRLDQSAKNAVSVTGRHTFGDTGFFVGGNWLYRQGRIQQFSIVRREWAYQKGYSTANVFAGYNTEIGGRTHTFRLNVQNALDGLYYDRTETFALGRRWFLSWGFDL